MTTAKTRDKINKNDILVRRNSVRSEKSLGGSGKIKIVKKQANEEFFLRIAIAIAINVYIYTYRTYLINNDDIL